jgi:predicted unusual protein kinase regulating ubiquinone biosynthesis (AarF/ABC1/UbiB family)
MLLRNSRFGLIDFGAVGSLDASFRQQLNQYNALIAEGSYIKAAEVYLDISSPLPGAQRSSDLGSDYGHRRLPA